MTISAYPRQYDVARSAARSRNQNRTINGRRGALAMNPTRVCTNRTVLDWVVADIEGSLAVRPQPFEDSCGNEFTIGRGPLLCVIVLAEVLIGVGAADRRTFGSKPVGVTTQDGFPKTPRSALNAQRLCPARGPTILSREGRRSPAVRRSDFRRRLYLANARNPIVQFRAIRGTPWCCPTTFPQGRAVDPPKPHV